MSLTARIDAVRGSFHLEVDLDVPTGGVEPPPVWAPEVNVP